MLKALEYGHVTGVKNITLSDIYTHKPHEFLLFQHVCSAGIPFSIKFWLQLRTLL